MVWSLTWIFTEILNQKERRRLSGNRMSRFSLQIKALTPRHGAKCNNSTRVNFLAPPRLIEIWHMAYGRYAYIHWRRNWLFDIVSECTNSMRVNFLSPPPVIENWSLDNVVWSGRMTYIPIYIGEGAGSLTWSQVQH